FSAFYGPFLFYGGMVIGETVGLFTTTLGVFLLVLFQAKRRTCYIFLAGLSLGISTLIRANMLIALPFLALGVLAIFRKDGIAKLLYYICAFSAGIVIALSPVMARNYISEKDIVPVTALGGFNFYIGNASGAGGGYRHVDDISANAEDMVTGSIEVAETRAGRKLKPSEVSSYWFRSALRSIRKNGPLYISGLMAKKFVLFWNSYEAPDIWDYYFFRGYIPILNFPFFNFSVIAALGILGMCLAWPRRRNAATLYFFIFGYMVSVLVFFVTSRYRMQVVPALSVFAGYSVVRAADILRERPFKIAAAAVVLAGAFLFSNIPVAKVSFAASHNSLGILLKRAGRFDEAEVEYKKALALKPDYPDPHHNLRILYREANKRGQATF
ncbi:MAG: tetratricopeptide repeat protein, partial [Candidatus Omnitrophica bacterium]|nr:tetratricopeptide repeat protein [Candidatus Omnitrophota bacterium]